MARLTVAISLVVLLSCIGIFTLDTYSETQLFAPLVPSANVRLPAQRLTPAEPVQIYTKTQGESPGPRGGSTNAAPLLAFLASFTAVASFASRGQNITMQAADPYAAVRSMVDGAPVAMISKTTCPFCKKAKMALESVGCTSFDVIEIDELPVEEMQDIQSTMVTELGSRTVPKVFFKGELLGGCDDTLAALKSGRLQELCEAVGAVGS